MSLSQANRLYEAIVVECEPRIPLRIIAHSDSVHRAALTYIVGTLPRGATFHSIRMKNGVRGMVDHGLTAGERGALWLLEEVIIFNMPVEMGEVRGHMVPQIKRGQTAYGYHILKMYGNDRTDLMRTKPASGVIQFRRGNHDERKELRGESPERVVQQLLMTTDEAPFGDAFHLAKVPNTPSRWNGKAEAKNFIDIGA
jgi:hypothetical protein